MYFKKFRTNFGMLCLYFNSQYVYINIVQNNGYYTLIMVKWIRNRTITSRDQKSNECQGFKGEEILTDSRFLS